MRALYVCKFLCYVSLTHVFSLLSKLNTIFFLFLYFEFLIKENLPLVCFRKGNIQNVFHNFRFYSQYNTWLQMVPFTPKVPILEKDPFESAFMCFCPLSVA